MVTRTPGPFNYYSDEYHGITGDSIRAAVDPVDGHASTLGTLAESLHDDEKQILSATEGDIRTAVISAPHTTADVARTLSAKAQFAAACTREFAADVDAFDTTVDGINVSYRSMTNSAIHDPDVKSGDVSLTDLQAGFLSTLKPRWSTADKTLDQQADDIAAKLKRGPTDEAVREFIRQGLMPLAAASLFPTLVLTNADLVAARNAEVRQRIARLREDGLLTGPDPDPSSYYWKWLENGVTRGIPLDEVIKIARVHGITPEDFEVLNGLEPVTDPDGKTFFILPTDISGDDARNAVLMTYILNAGTDYGKNPDTDYPETPYSSDEIGRIKERQDKNNWFSYNQDVGFVNDNGGRLATTPNGMLMGLGGNGLQDLYSLNGGTTFGDIFMMNIDDPDDPAAALRQIIRSGEGATTDDQGNPTTRNDHLDLDRLLHHEEIHSQQWAKEGYFAFIAGYLNESVDVDWKGWGPFRVPVPHTVDGKDNSYEAGAGLTDGGYDE